MWWSTLWRRPKTLAGVAGSSALVWYMLLDPSAEEGLDDELLPTRYDPAAIEEFWREWPRVVTRRALGIVSSCVPLVGGLVLDHACGRLSDPEVARARAGQARQLFVDLGPSFIKFGQMLSIRPDLVPAAAIVELQQLCDGCPAFPTADAVATIEEELGRPVAEVFVDLDMESLPIAAASLGQVYRATLRATGEQVAVKVQRPDMIRGVSLDLFLLRQYARAVEHVKASLMAAGVLAPRRQFDVHLVETFAGASYQEMDYVNEAANQQRFMRELVPRIGAEVLHIPRVFASSTTRKVLVSEWVDGKQLAKSSPEEINRLVPVGVACFMAQLLDMGFFHSDPHPGNLLVDRRGRLVLLDFGLCASVSRPDADGMTAALVHLMGGDVPELVEDAVKLGFLPPDVDRAALLPRLQRIFDDGRLAARRHQAARGPADDEGANKGPATARGSLDPRSSAWRPEQRRRQFRAISDQLNSVFFDFPFLVPSYFALITRALVVLEGIAVTGDPHFDIFNAAYPYATRRAVDVFGWKNTIKLIGAAGAAEIKGQPLV